MGGSPSRSYPDPWEGTLDLARVAIDVVPYVMLAFSAILTLVIAHAYNESPLIPLVLCGLAAAWTLGMYTLHPAWRDRPRLMGVFVAVLLAIMTAMVVNYSWLGFYSFTGYYYVYRLVGSWRWRIAAAGLIACLSGISQGLGLQLGFDAVHVTLLAGAILINVVLACAFVWFNWMSHRQSLQRGQLIDELAETNGKLEATLAENTGLHRQLLVQAREAGILDERQRMAREMHDTLAQDLTGIITQLQAAEQADQDPAERRRHFAAAVTLARESLTEARRSVYALRPEALETARLGEALTAVAHRWAERSGVPAQVAVTGTVRPMTPEAESALLRAAQEALANVAKHAAATRAGLTLSYMDDEVVLDVRDDGKGFNPSAASAAGGFGLVAMRQRIEGLSGTLDVESEPGLGTAISARVPVATTEAAAEEIAAEPARAGS
jgi:signal transduction histidine kinase